jgi:hypothetical protein
MRKVLLATTALVAMSVTGAHAQSADLSISGSHQTAYFAEDHSTAGDSDGMVQDGNIVFTATMTADSGLAVTGMTSLGSFNGTEEDSYVQVADDFGSLRLGGADSLTDAIDGSITMYSIPENFGEGTLNRPTLMYGAGARLTNHSLHDGNVKASYRTPTINMGAASFNFAASATPGIDGIATQFVVNAGAFSFGYGMDEHTLTTAVAATAGGNGAQPVGDYTSSMMGVGMNFGDVTVRFADGDANYTTVAGVETNKVDRTEYGVAYSGIENTTMYWAVSEEKETVTLAAAETFTHTHIGLNYTIVPGLALKVESGTEELKTAALESQYNAIGLQFSW